MFGGEIKDQLETEAERDHPDPDDAAPELILEKNIDFVDIFIKKSDHRVNLFSDSGLT